MRTATGLLRAAGSGRRTAAVVLAVALLLLAGLALPGTGARSAAALSATARVTVPAHTGWHSTVSGGIARRYLLATPAGGGRTPLLVALHGLGQTTPGFLRTTGLVQASLDAGVAVLAPETPDRSWNDGRFGATGRDDDGFVLGVVDDLVARGLVDRTRVVLAGFSNGAGLSAALLSRHPGRFAGVLMVGGELLASTGSPRPQAPVEAVLVHGTDDPVQPWEGRGRRSRKMPAQVGVPATVRAFLEVDGSAAHAGTVPRTAARAATVPRAAAGPARAAGAAVALPHTRGRVRVVRQRWEGLQDVTLYRLVGAGHVWPRGSCPARGCRGTVARVADVSATTLAVQLAQRARLVLA